MQTQWIALHDIPANGREFSFRNPEIWDELWSEFGVECRATKDIVIDYTIIPAANGIYFRGNIHGEVVVPCSRCLENAHVHLDNDFDFFEDLSPDDDELPTTLLREQGGDMEFDIIAVAWEQFLIALPDKAVCSPTCKGLCPHCGQNLNTAECSCGTKTGDPRLSAFRNLKITNK